MILYRSIGFIYRNNILLGDYSLGFLDHLFDNSEIGQGFMNPGCRESDTMSNLFVREFL